jgi:hypothetical protein
LRDRLKTPEFEAELVFPRIQAHGFASGPFLNGLAICENGCREVGFTVNPNFEHNGGYPLLEIIEPARTVANDEPWTGKRRTGASKFTRVHEFVLVLSLLSQSMRLDALLLGRSDTVRLIAGGRITTCGLRHGRLRLRTDTSCQHCAPQADCSTHVETKTSSWG